LAASAWPTLTALAKVVSFLSFLFFFFRHDKDEDIYDSNSSRSLVPWRILINTKADLFYTALTLRADP